ncbi:MAG TPA: class I SAM-dependent methyltransferase [Balneolales bacterium]|nr:class I SAM-dependent methyltransferase [Balneolales bacterium]
MNIFSAAAKDRRISSKELAGAYRETSNLYPFVPSMSIWRAWELAAYRRYTLHDPILDVGCGDGLYFKLVWPSVRQVTGVDINPDSIKAAKRSGVYQSVHECSALDMPFQANSFSSAFANCSLEHMDDLPGVMSSIARVLKPGGGLLCSVVTDKFIKWSMIPLLAEAMGDAKNAQRLKTQYLRYHHLVSALLPDGWISQFEAAGFEVIEHIPIMPELLGRLFMFIDTLWHLPHGEAEVGDMLVPHFQKWRNFPEAIGELMLTLLKAEPDWTAACGAVFYARKRG